jgi:hypothetical protein
MKSQLDQIDRALDAAIAADRGPGWIAECQNAKAQLGLLREQMARAEAAWQNRERDLLTQNNLSLEKARRFEDEANQDHCDALLWRTEVKRLRESHSKLAGFIEECHKNAGEAPPEEIVAEMDAVFPPEVSAADLEPDAIDPDRAHDAHAIVEGVRKMDAAETCWICGKAKGQPPGRCPGHYAPLPVQLSLEERVAAWVRTCIGEAHMHSRERAMRLLEEAVELAQAEGITAALVAKQVQHVYSRPPGGPGEEAAGVAVCLLGWCAATGHRFADLALAEVERIEAKPLDRILGSLARKADADLVTCVPVCDHEWAVAEDNLNDVWCRKCHRSSMGTVVRQ